VGTPRLLVVVRAVRPYDPGLPYALSRPRPHWRDPITVEHVLSDPSGHATDDGMLITPAVTLLVLVTLPWPGYARPPCRRPWTMGFLVAASRIFLGVLYLSDVVAGLILGAALTLLG
jgi:membrane-associated phospholipid phosphatase